MGYEGALRAAGYDVVAFEYFGSYQGDWLAVVQLDGKKSLIHGWYGSCSGCDAFEAEFGWDYEDMDDKKLAQFGASYFPMNDRELTDFVIRHTGDSIWGIDDAAMMKFIEAQGLVTLEGEGK